MGEPGQAAPRTPTEGPADGHQQQQQQQPPAAADQGSGAQAAASASSQPTGAAPSPQQQQQQQPDNNASSSSVQKDHSGSSSGRSNAAATAEQLNLKVLGQDGQVVAFRIKKTTPFRKLMHAYCDRQKIIQSTIRFVFDGHRLKETDTPKSFDMEEDDTIEVFAQQSGGCGPLNAHHSRWRAALAAASRTKEQYYYSH